MENFFENIYDMATMEAKKSGEELVRSSESAMDAKATLWKAIADILRDLDDTARFDVASGTISILKTVAVASAVGVREAADDALDVMASVADIASGDGDEA